MEGQFHRRNFLNIAPGYHQDLLMKKEGWKGSDKATAINETTFGKMNDKLRFGKNCKQIWLPNGCLLEQGDAFSCRATPMTSPMRQK